MASYVVLLKEGVRGVNEENTSIKSFIIAKYIEYNKDMSASERDSLYHYKYAFYAII